MKYKIVSVLSTRFLLLGLLSVPLLLLFILISVSFHLNLSKIIFIIAIILMFFFVFTIAIKYSKKVIDILLTEDRLEFDGVVISFKEIEGYNINREGVLTSTIELKDKNHNVYSITALNICSKSKEFELFLSDFTEKAHCANKDIKELSFFDFHSRQQIFIKVIVYFGAIALTIFNLIYFYLIFTDKIRMSWKILWLDLLFVSILGFYQKNMQINNK